MKWLLTLVLASLLAACSSVPVSTDYATDFNFSTVRSYAWLEGGGDSQDPLADNDLVRQRVKEAVDSQMAARGFRLATGDDAPSVLLTYHFGLEDKTEIESFGGWYSRFGYYPCYHCLYRPGFSPFLGPDGEIWVREYTESTLIIDIIDPETKGLVWRGSSARRQPTLDNPEDRRLHMLETVSAILAKFPPGSAAQ